MSALYRALDRKRSCTEPTLRALVQVLVSQINGCEFCDDLNSSLAIERGIAPEKLMRLRSFEDSEMYSEREKCALRYAEAVTRSDRRVEPALVSMLRQYFDDQEIVEFAALIAYQNMSSKFNAALGVAAQGFCATLRAPAKRRS